MELKRQIIYVPGLTDKTWHIRGGQRAALSLWRLSGVRARYFVADWANKNETYAAKRDRLIEMIDSFTAKGLTVSLVSVSAGSSLALSAFARRTDKVAAFVSICGMFKHPKAVDEAIFAFNPAFKPAMLAAEEDEHKLSKTERQKILVVRAAHDSYVPRIHGNIIGAHTTTIPTIGHVFTILMAISVFHGRILRFIKKAK